MSFAITWNETELLHDDSVRAILPLERHADTVECKIIIRKRQPMESREGKTKFALKFASSLLLLCGARTRVSLLTVSMLALACSPDAPGEERKERE